jgi:DNA-binding NarL/FixJ family response regulator
MATILNKTLNHRKDPARLTPYEEKILELKQRGLSYSEIAKALDGKCSVRTLRVRYQVIKEKLELLEHQNG